LVRHEAFGKLGVSFDGPKSGRLATFLALTLAAVLASAALAFGLNFPPLTGRVVDEAGIIPEPVRVAISDKLEALEAQSGIQFVVATVKSLEGQEIEPYANALFRHWGLGEKDKNNGLLLLVAPTERRVRIETGYGLEGTLTDALSKIIITNAITPRFKAGDFGGGIERGVEDIITVLTTDSEEWEKRPDLRVERRDTKTDDWAPFIALALFLLIVFLLMRTARRPVAPRSRWGRGARDFRRRGWITRHEPLPPRPRSDMDDFLAALGAWLGSRRGRGDDGGWGSGPGSFGGGFSGGGGSSGGGGASGSW
jgi:uncharacterized protein